ncbi:MAG: PAS domain S-box protein [Gemmataceae bacterium]|nr:PAS domain S-box protein [Gemmataceae bacterium]
MSADDSKPFLSSLAHHAADPFRLLVESVVDYAIYMVDPAGTISSWNPGAERIYGYQADEIIGRPFTSVFLEEDVASGKAEQAWQQVVSQGRCEHESLRVRRDGTQFWAVVNISNLKDVLGRHVGFCVVTRDITERKQAEDALRKEHDLTSAILGSLPGVFYLYTGIPQMA